MPDFPTPDDEDENGRDDSAINQSDTETQQQLESDPQHEFEIIVCHANVIRYFFCRALQLPPEAWLRLCTFNCSLTYLQFDLLELSAVECWEILVICLMNLIPLVDILGSIGESIREVGQFDSGRIIETHCTDRSWSLQQFWTRALYLTGIFNRFRSV